MNPTINEMLRAFLEAQGFSAMAREVVAETDPDTLRKYARVVVKAAPQSQRLEILNRFRLLNLA